MSDYESESLAQNTVQALWKVTKVILDSLDFSEVVQSICDSLLNELGYLKLGYRVIVLSLYNPQLKGLERIALSQTPEAVAAMKVSTIPFKDIVIPLEAVDNLCVRSYLDKKMYSTTDWKDILTPPLEPDDARKNQQASGIKTSLIFPIILKNESVGVVILSLVKDEEEVSYTEQTLIRGFTEIVGIAVQNAKLYSDLQETTQMLNKANEKLEVLDKLKDEFVGLASHELRTPMTAIKSYTWMVLNNKSGEITQKTREFLDRVYNSTERLIQLVNEMLDVSRIESGRVQLKSGKMDLVKLAVDVQQEFGARATEQNISVVISGESAVEVNADREKLHQVMENLVGNAFKFTTNGGKIEIGIAKDGNVGRVFVKDNGPGIAKEDLGKLFTKFGRGDKPLIALKQEGTGLGLYISKQYVELMGGKIWFESELGEGATFSFEIPLYREAELV